MEALQALKTPKQEAWRNSSLILFHIVSLGRTQRSTPLFCPRWEDKMPFCQTCCQHPRWWWQIDQRQAGDAQDFIRTELHFQYSYSSTRVCRKTQYFEWQGVIFNLSCFTPYVFQYVGHIYTFQYNHSFPVLANEELRLKGKSFAEGQLNDIWRDWGLLVRFTSQPSDLLTVRGGFEVKVQIQ